MVLQNLKFQNWVPWTNKFVHGTQCLCEICAKIYVVMYKRDQANKRRDMRIKYLIEMWRKLERTTERGEDKSRLKDMEEVIADIQLLGSGSQIKLAIEIAETLAKKGKVTVNNLLEELRKDLRKELNLEPVSVEIKALRAH